jgi:hypothetical protein
VKDVTSSVQSRGPASPSGGHSCLECRAGRQKGCRFDSRAEEPGRLQNGSLWAEHRLHIAEFIMTVILGPSAHRCGLPNVTLVSMMPIILRVKVVSLQNRADV